MTSASSIDPWTTATTLWPVVPWPSKAWSTGSSPAFRSSRTICRAAFASPSVPVSRPWQSGPARAFTSDSRSWARTLAPSPNTAAARRRVFFILFPRLSFRLPVARLPGRRDLPVHLGQEDLDRLLQRRVAAALEILVRLRRAEVGLHPVALEIPAVGAEPALRRDGDLRAVPHRPLVPADHASGGGHPHQVSDSQIAECEGQDLLVAPADLVLHKDHRLVPGFPRGTAALGPAAVDVRRDRAVAVAGEAGRRPVEPVRRRRVQEAAQGAVREAADAVAFVEDEALGIGPFRLHGGLEAGDLLGHHHPDVVVGQPSTAFLLHQLLPGRDAVLVLELPEGGAFQAPERDLAGFPERRPDPELHFRRRLGPLQREQAIEVRDRKST